MSLIAELESQGQLLFRWRTFVPLVFLPLLAIAAADAHWPFGSYWCHEVWERLCLFISFAGLGVRILTAGHVPAGTSGRNTRLQIAETLNTTGMYSIVRHPLYLGNFLIGLGAVLAPFEGWLVASYVLAFWLYYERIMMAEEQFLRQRFPSEFDSWAKSAPSFFPNPWKWKAAAQPFCWRTAVRREYTGFFVVILLHAIAETAELWTIHHRLIFETFWVSLLVAGAIGYVVARTLKRHSTLLDQPGR
jgi:protein-S-isoprenylcysteine O-methyltransferase Ste14